MISRKLKGEKIPKVKFVEKKYNYGKESPLQDRVLFFIYEHPECSVMDICKGINHPDFAAVRNVIRKMVESHKIIQRFSIK